MNFKPIQDFNDFTALSERCYPGMKLKSKEDRERYTEHRKKMDKEKNVHTIGLYEKDRLLAGYIVYDQIANVYGASMQASGIGTVAVDLMNKKQGHAKRIIKKFLLDAREQGRPLTQLYPFQPAFYKKMGFGLGPRLSTYRFHPSQLPTFEDVGSVEVLTSDDRDAVSRCYHDWAHATHGGCDKPGFEFSFLSKGDWHNVGVWEDGKLTGYLSFDFQQQQGDHFLQNDLMVRNFITTSITAYQSLLQFLHNQKDQVRTIVFPTFDERFSMLLDDPTHVDQDLIYTIYHKTSEAAQGLMYRIVDIPRFLDGIKHHSFGSETVRIGWRVHDSLLEEDYQAVWKFEEGKPVWTDEPADVTISLGIGAFSSLLMGCVTLRDFLYSGAVEVTETEALPKAISLFEHPTEPECWSFF